MSTTPDRTLTDPEQRIADLERQLAERDAALAECKAERDEALEQQTATTEVLGVINSSPGDLAPVFDAMLERAMRLCEAAFGIMGIREGDQPHAVAVRGVPPAYAEFRHRNPSPPTAPLWSRFLKGEVFIHTVDLKAEEVYVSGDPQRRALVDLGGARTSLAVALMRDRELLGAIQIYRAEVRPFTDKQIALLQNFAAQAVIAMENARLLTETGEALEQQTATAEVLGVINSSPGDLKPVFNAILEKAHTLCGADAGSFAINDGERLPAVATRGYAPEHAAVAGEGILTRGRFGERLARGEITHIPDMTAPGDRGMGLRQSPDRTENAIARNAVEITGSRAYLAVPLRKDGALLGYLSAHRTQVRPFSDKEIALLQNFAAQAVIAMENARLLTETREALEQQTATAEVLGVINSSPGDLNPVFDAMLEKAVRLCDGVNGILWTFEGKRARLAASRNVSPPIVEQLRQQGESGTHPMVQRVISSDHLIQFDLAEHGACRSAEVTAGPDLIASGVRTVIWVALVKDGIPVGAFVISRQEVRPFSDAQIALLQNFAAQAVIAMENARLITETREALEQQTATAEVLGVINSSPGDLVPVFDAILEKAHTLGGATYGSLTLADGEYFRAVATRGIPQAFDEILRQPFRPFPRFQERLMRGEDFVHEADLSQFSSDDPIYRAAVELGGVRTLLMVPLRKDGVLLGYFTAARQEVLPFADKQIALIKNFGTQAVIAMENARLINETREALEQQTATAEVLQVINSSPGDLAPVFDAMLERSVQLCDAAQGVLRTYDGEFNFVAVRGEPRLMELARQQGSIRIRPVGPFGSLVEGERVVHFADIRRSEVYRKNPHARASIDLGGGRSWLAVALRSEKSLLGAISVYRQEVRPFTDKQIALLENFAAHAVIAMENARLLGELRQRTDEIAELNRGLEARVADQVEELGRVGRLKRFLAPQLAELIVSQGDEKILESHRREIVVVFRDLRGYTAFTETAEPEEVLEFLRHYHGALGPLVSQFEGTLDQFSGDGIMVFFNDPVPCPDPAERAVKMAMAMREAASTLIADWRERGRDLGLGVGIAQGYATLGQIGFTDRSGYTAIGTVCNVAARLCAEAKDSQILLGQRVNVGLKGSVATEQVGALTLRGLTQPVVAYNVPLAIAQPALHVIDGGGPQSV